MTEHVYVERKDTGQTFTSGDFVRLTKDKIFVRDPETQAIESYDRSVFRVVRPSSIKPYHRSGRPRERR